LSVKLRWSQAEFKEQSSKKLSTSSDSIRTDVTVARLAQLERFEGMPILYSAADVQQTGPRVLPA